MTRIILFALIILVSALAVNAQVRVPEHIAQQLKGSKNFRAYSRLMTKYLDSLKLRARDSATINSIERQYKKLARQLYYLEGHLDENGDIVNVNEKNMRAMQEYAQSEMAQTESPHLGNWSIVGPQHVVEDYGNRGIGRVDRIAFHPTNTSVYYAGTPAGGLWKTTNGGISWSNVNSYIPSLGISGIVVSHANPSTLYVLTGDGDSNLGVYGFVEGFDYIRPSIGVLKSTDDGVSWNRTNLDIPGFYVGYKLIQSPVDANVLLAATSKGIYRTADGGNSWNLVSSDSARYYDIEWRPNSTAMLYACTRNRFFISASAGQSFADVTNRIPEDISGCGRLALAVTPNNENVLYVLAGQNGSSSVNLRLFRSTNSGGNFFLRSTANLSGGAVEYMLNVAASSNDFNKVVTGNLFMRFSEDGGTSFIRSSNDNDDAFQNYAHADVHELIYNPLDGILYMGTDGGVFTTDDHGADINQKFLGMSATQFYHFNIDDNDQNLVIGGAQDNGMMYKNDNTTFFRNYLTGDGFDIAVPHGEGNFIVTTINKGTFFFQKNFPSTYWFLGDETNVWFKSVATSWFDSTKYMGGLKIYKWRTFGPSVSTSSSEANGRWALVTSPSNGNRLYCAGGPDWNDEGDQADKTLSRSDDNAVTWTNLQNNSGFPSSFSKITSIAVHPANSNRVWVTMGGYQAIVKVFYSANAGASWINLSVGLPNVPVNAAVVNDNGDLYIGTDIGVFYRTETGSWMPFFNGLPKVPVTDLEIRNGVVYASTFGRGIWMSSVRGNCPLTINITSNQSGRIVYEARNITASSQLINGAGTEIYLKAETETILSPGFIANANTGAEFKSWIAPCGTGGLPLLVSTTGSKNTMQTQLDSTTVQFELKFPALVSLYETDADGNIHRLLQPATRLKEGKQQLPVPSLNSNSKLVLVVDGEAIAIN